jgi:hypothetical protein
VIQMTRRRILGILLASAVLLIAQAPAFGQEAPTAPLKVLFVGNSYTSVNDLPAVVAGLAEAAGGRRIEVDRHLVGGCTLEKHVKDQKAIDKIRAEKWDVVVLQEQSLRPVIDRQSMHEYARLLDAEIKKQGAKTIFYLTWARQHVPDMQEGSEPAYHHTQKAPWFLLLFGFAALFFTVAWVARAEPVLPAILLVSGLLMATLGYSNHRK